MEISVFTFLCYPCIFIVFTFYCIVLNSQNKSNKIPQQLISLRYKLTVLGHKLLGKRFEAS